MKLASVALLLVFFAASPEARFFRYERPVQVQARQAGQACLVVHPDIFVHAASQLADLRLYAGGNETPYTLRVATAVAGSEKVIPLLNAGLRDGQTVFDAELQNTRYSDLQLTINAQNFIATVTVTGSNMGFGNHQTKLGDFTIFDLGRQRLGRSTVLHLPESTFPYLHFRIAGPLRPEDVTGLSVEPMPRTQPRYQTIAETSKVVQKDHATIVEFDLPPHVPVDRVVIAPGDTPAAFSRDVTLSAAEAVDKSADNPQRPPFTRSTSGNLLRIHKVQDGKRIDEERLSIEDPVELEFASPSRWTMTIANGDDPPVSLQSVRLEMRERTLCFEATANTAYMLRYGDPALSAPQYDFARLFSPQASILVATAGPEQPNAGWQPRPDERPFTEKHPILLWVTLIGVITLLAAIAYGSQKQAPRAI